MLPVCFDGCAAAIAVHVPFPSTMHCSILCTTFLLSFCPNLRRYYGNTRANLERLLNLLSNEVVTVSMKFLPNEFLLCPEKVSTDSVYKME